MTKEELLARLGQIEWHTIEFKEARAAVPKSAYETVSAFANTQGGGADLWGAGGWSWF